jgi:hypothetical protein
MSGWRFCAVTGVVMWVAFLCCAAWMSGHGLVVRLAGLPAWYRKVMSSAERTAAGFTVVGGGGVHHAQLPTRWLT